MENSSPIDLSSLSDADVVALANAMTGPEQPPFALERTVSVVDPAPGLGLEKKQHTAAKNPKVPKMTVKMMQLPAKKRATAAPRKRMAETAAETELEKIRRVSAKLRNTSPKELEQMGNTKTLSEITHPAVLLLKNGHVVDNGYGKTLLADYTSSNANDASDDKLALPGRLFPETEIGNVLPTQVVVYLGQKELTKNRTCYDLHKVPVGVDDTPESVYNKMINMTPEEMRMKVRVSNFSDFPSPSVFVCTKLRPQVVGCNGEERTVAVMTYETEVDGEAICGEMFLPDRCVAETKGKLPVILLYKGEKESRNGRTYYDVRVMDTNKVQDLLNRKE